MYGQNCSYCSNCKVTAVIFAIATSNAAMPFTPHMMMSLQNNNNNNEMNHQRRPSSFSRSLYLRKEVNTPKKEMQ